MKAIIIGNSPYEGNDVDVEAYDEVVRMNNYKLGYGLGMKTTVWANGIGEIGDRYVGDLRIWNVNPLFTFWNGAHNLGVAITRLGLTNNYKFITEDRIRAVYDEIGYSYEGFPHPSTGILTIRLALEEFDGYDIDICNFAFFKDSVDGTNKQHHYWGEDDGFDKTHKYVASAHDGEIERDYVEQLINKYDNLNYYG